MTQEEHRALDCLVAEKVMGWERTIITVEKGDPTAWRTGDPQRPVAASWHPSADIKAAWEVVERIEKNFIFSVETGYRDNQWRCYLENEDNWVTHVSQFGETAPLAICRAAICSLVDMELHPVDWDAKETEAVLAALKAVDGK